MYLRSRPFYHYRPQCWAQAIGVSVKIVSTNVSTAKTVVHNGKEIKTGIFKKPTPAEAVIEKLNIIGDEQADLVNHGGEHKAVYAFAAEHYSYWRGVLENSTLSAGRFGENFTVEGLAEDQIKIGDQLRFGTALLEVSQPRVPCFKLGIALDNKMAPNLFTKNYCTGVYFRVLQPGVAKTGDTVERVESQPHEVTVRALFQSFFDKDYSGAADVMAAALALDTLAPEWKSKLEKRLLAKG